MTKDEALKLALEAMTYADACLKKQLTTKDKHQYAQALLLEAGTAIKEALANEALEKMAENARELGLDYEPEQEPVAWLHRFIEGGISIGLKPADLERHPERWEPLYTEPKPCPTCEALARTVMLDQTSHDTTPPQRTWVGLKDEEVNTIYEQAEVLVNDSWVGNGTVGLMFPVTLYKMFEAKLKEKNT